MNKYQEAIMLVREMLNTAEPNVMNHLAANRKLDHELQELVDKTTPHKLLKNGLCKCGARVIVSFQDYCTQCGQAIDWSEE